MSLENTNISHFYAQILVIPFLVLLCNKISANHKNKGNKAFSNLNWGHRDFSKDQHWWRFISEGKYGFHLVPRAIMALWGYHLRSILLPSEELFWLNKGLRHCLLLLKLYQLNGIRKLKKDNIILYFWVKYLNVFSPPDICVF